MKSAKTRQNSTWQSCRFFSLKRHDVALKDEDFHGGARLERHHGRVGFVIRALAGRKYHVGNLADRGYGKHHAEPVAVYAGDGTVAVGIVLSEEGPNCDRCRPQGER